MSPYVVPEIGKVPEHSLEPVQVRGSALSKKWPLLPAKDQRGPIWPFPFLIKTFLRVIFFLWSVPYIPTPHISHIHIHMNTCMHMWSQHRHAIYSCTHKCMHTYMFTQHTAFTCTHECMYTYVFCLHTQRHLYFVVVLQLFWILRLFN